MTQGPVAENPQIQRRLEVAELVFCGTKGELGVDGPRGGDARRAGLGGFLDGDGRVLEVPNERAEERFVEAVVVTEVNVATAKAAVVLNHYRDGQQRAKIGG